VYPHKPSISKIAIRKLQKQENLARFRFSIVEFRVSVFRSFRPAFRFSSFGFFDPFRWPLAR